MTQKRGAASLVAVAALIAALALPARAQEVATSEDQWSFTLTPYVWFASVEGDVATISGLPTAEVDAGFDDIIENTDFTFMVAGEARRGPFGVITDLNFLSLSADSDTPGPLFDGAEVESRTFFATVAGFYRVFADERFDLDALAGARVWYVDTELDLDGGLLSGRTTEEDELWADPIIGARGRGELGRGFFLTGTASVGGFDIGSESTWEILATLGYQFSERFFARAGYRHLEVDFEDGGFVWDVEFSGPIVGASFRF